MSQSTGGGALWLNYTVYYNTPPPTNSGPWVCPIYCDNCNHCNPDMSGPGCEVPPMQSCSQQCSLGAYSSTSVPDHTGLLVIGECAACCLLWPSSRHTSSATVPTDTWKAARFSVRLLWSFQKKLVASTLDSRPLVSCFPYNSHVRHFPSTGQQLTAWVSDYASTIRNLSRPSLPRPLSWATKPDPPPLSTPPQPQ